MISRHYWKINGKKEAKLEAFTALSLRTDIVGKYFPLGMKPLPNASPAPDNVPPAKWKPPVMGPGSLVPELLRMPGATRFAAAIMKMVMSIQAQQILDGSAIAIIVDTDVYNRIVGSGIVARQLGLLQVRSDPTVTLYRQTLLVLGGLGAGGQGAIAAAIGGAWALGAVWQLGAALVVESGFVSSAIQAIRATSPLIETFLSAVRGSPLAGMAAVDGASMLVFAVPHASAGDPGKPISVSISVPICKFLTPREAQRTRPGQTVSGGIVVALLGTGPD